MSEVLTYDVKDYVPEKIYDDITSVKNDDLTDADMISFIDAAVSHFTLVGHNIKSFNELLSSGIPKIITEMFRIDKPVQNERMNITEDIKTYTSFNIRIRFSNVKIHKPTYATFVTGNITDLWPNKARNGGGLYAGPLTLAAHITLEANRTTGGVEKHEVDIPDMEIASIPIMIKSDCCHTANKTKEILKRMEEDPNEQGGYFITKSKEYAIELLESTRFNSLHVHLAIKKKEFVRGEFISQPGNPFQNSSQIIIRYNVNQTVTFEFKSTRLKEGVKIPFYLIYRIFGMTSDEEITKTILFDIDDDSAITKNMSNIIETALHLTDKTYAALKDVIEVPEIIKTLAQKLSQFTIRGTDETAIQQLNESFISVLDNMILPHIGTTAETRLTKLRYIGLLIHKTLLVHLNVLKPTDRDSFKIKRVHGSGISISRAFKTQFNHAIVRPLLQRFASELKNKPFSEITSSVMSETFKSAVKVADLVRNMESAITAGNKTVVIRRQIVKNRISSQILERKNYLNVISTLRTITSHNATSTSKQTERADLMRRVHASFPGYICVSQSAPEGESVGMRKQLAITASVCTAGDADAFKVFLLSDPDVYKLDEVASEQMLHENLPRILLNGEWIGFCKTLAYQFVKKYRLLRREGKVVGRYTTISLDVLLNEIEFWLDTGRLVRPLLIVDNNIDQVDATHGAYEGGSKETPSTKDEDGSKETPSTKDEDESKETPSTKDEDESKETPSASSTKTQTTEFCQNIRFTLEHARKICNGEITMDDLVMEGIAEFITPEEEENCYIAESIVKLREDKHNILTQYTHCEIPQAIFGLASLISPFGNHTQPPRITFESQQSRQTCGWYAMSFPWRVDTNKFWQIYNEYPLIKTLSHHYVMPNGSNTIIAYTTAKGDNLEDSVIACQASLDRGLFAGAFYRYGKVALERGERFAAPNAAVTKNIKPNASYAKLDVDGFIKIGTIVQKGDVVIGIIAEIEKTEDDSKFKFVDKSQIYSYSEPAIIDMVSKPVGANDDHYGIVRYRSVRPLIIGDKMASRSGNKSIVAAVLSQSDMPYTKSGLTPDLIVNPHSFPSRMTIGQMLETSLAKVCAQKGCIADGTTFLPIEYADIGKQLVSLGFRYNGCETMYSGETGTYFDAAIFIGPTYEQRLLKFVIDDKYSVAGTGPTDATTGQPLKGKNIGGGLRIGEMELWCLESHGTMFNSYEKMSIHSDGRKIYVCRNCGDLAIYNREQDIYRCPNCKEMAEIVAFDSKKTASVFMEEVMASNIKMMLGMQQRTFESDELAIRSKKIEEL
jgi:DNA-directed RNA polymerase beta subunit